MCILYFQVSVLQKCVITTSSTKAKSGQNLQNCSKLNEFYLECQHQFLIELMNSILVLLKWYVLILEVIRWWCNQNRKSHWTRFLPDRSYKRPFEMRFPLVLFYFILSWYLFCSFSVWCLGNEAEFDCIGSWSLTFHLIFNQWYFKH